MNRKKKSNQPIINFAALAFQIQRFECTRVHVQAGSLCFKKSLEKTKTLLKNKNFMSFSVFLISCFVGIKTRCGDKKISERK